jgi:molybdate transport system substrate-binding protein
MALRRLIGLGLAAGLAFASVSAATAEPVKVFAAASLKNALDAVGAAWSAKDKSKSIAATYAASSALAKQIEGGAPADVFISADLDWMDYLNKKKLIKDGTQHAILGNTLVLVAPAGSGIKLDLKPGADIAGVLGGGKIAICDVKAVPAGKYAKASFEKLGLWAAVEPNIAQSENVRAALAFVARSEAKLGVVYATDAKAEPKVEVIATFPDDSHAPIVYPGAQIAASTNADDQAFLDFLSSTDAKAIFAKQGFLILQH